MLVVFIVLVVPVFLDGPGEDLPVVSETMTLPGQNGQQRTRQTIVLERDRSEPVPTRQVAANDDNDENKPAAIASQEPAARPAADAVARQPAPEQPVKVSAAPAKQVPSTPPPEVPARSTTEMWAVQLGSFSRKENADRLAAELRNKGYAAFISQLSQSGEPLHRVRIGPQKNRDDAEMTAAKLAKDGVKSQVVPHP